MSISIWHFGVSGLVSLILISCYQFYQFLGKQAAGQTKCEFNCCKSECCGVVCRFLDCLLLTATVTQIDNQSIIIFITVSSGLSPFWDLAVDDGWNEKLKVSATRLLVVRVTVA